MACLVNAMHGQKTTDMLKVFFLVTLIPPLYLCLRLVCKRAWPLWTRLAGCAFLLVISQVYSLNSAIFRNLSGPDMPDWLLLLQIWLFTSMLLFFLVLLVRDVWRAAWHLLCAAWRRLRAFRRPASVPGRRAFLRQGLSVGMTLCAPTVCLGTAAAGLARGTAVPQLQHTEVFFPHLPPGLDGFRIAQLTDVHIGPLTSIDWVRQVVARTNAARPDLICLTGDLTDGRWDYQVARGGSRREAVREFSSFRAQHGVFACTGNHEYYSDYAGWMALYEDVGIRMLHNAAVVLQHHDALLALAGMDDDMAYGLKPVQTKASLLPAMPGHAQHALRIVLDHRPIRAAEHAAAGADLQLSGHTHGGQCLGMDRIVARANKGFVRGWYAVSGMPLYVSNGVGLWSGFPVRLGIPAEIALITLRLGTGPALRQM